MEIAPVTLEGQHVRLTPMSEDYIDDLWRVHGDGSLTQWYANPIADYNGMVKYVRAALQDQASGKSTPFITWDKATGQLAGSTRLTNIDVRHRRTEIGSTWLGEPWQRTALNTEAKLLMLTHAFEVWNCLRVELLTDVLNLKSRQAIARLGAVEEGIFRNHYVCASGRIRDSVCFSIIDREWPDVKARLIERLSRPS